MQGKYSIGKDLNACFWCGFTERDASGHVCLRFFNFNVVDEGEAVIDLT